MTFGSDRTVWWNAEDRTRPLLVVIWLVLDFQPMTDSILYDCTRCGACCRCFPIFASEVDAAREPMIRKESLLLALHLRKAERSYKLFPLPFLEQCSFLKEDQLCRIYETRPDVCRHFEPGGVQCIEARKRSGILDAVQE